MHARGPTVVFAVMSALAWGCGTGDGGGGRRDLPVVVSDPGSPGGDSRPGETQFEAAQDAETAIDEAIESGPKDGQDEAPGEVEGDVDSPAPDPAPDPGPEPSPEPGPEHAADQPAADEAAAPEAGCETDEDCGTAHWCDGGTCRLCIVDAHCGNACVACAAPTPRCFEGACAECRGDPDCGEGSWCDHGTCRECGMDDPDHCGTGCEPCWGPTPACVAGVCACEGDSCGKGFRCEAGACARCDDETACGPTCSPCGGQTPFCNPDKGCVQCADDTACAQEMHCADGTCVPDCQVTDGCATDLAPDGKKCSTARVIGRTAAMAGPGFVHEGDTNYGGNDDDTPSQIFGPSECWDADYDLMYRIYLLSGETLSVTLLPLDPTKDLMLKLYSGTKCFKDGVDPIDCWPGDGDGKPDVISAFVAPSDGWYTIVVDGRASVDEDHGPFRLTVHLACLRPDCCCT